jgi:GH15 family glucan-1,4-alpha-glucosidase
MPQPIERYALISDCYSGAMAGLDGSIDWLCMPRYDSPSVFGALLGDKEHGRWRLAPADPGASASRAYDGETLVLVTRWTMVAGVVEVTDFMPRVDHRADVVRRIRGIEGRVPMRQDLTIRFDYGKTLPWVRQVGDPGAPALLAAAGPNAVIVRGPELVPDGNAHANEFTVAAGEVVDLTLTWFHSHRDAPPPLDVDAALATTRDWWADWADGCVRLGGRYDGDVIRSLLFLRALTHFETGGIVAAATTSLPESFGGTRNWDYRYVWLRDASLTLNVLVSHGYLAASDQWREWLLRAVAGDPADLQIMYGIAGERDLAERTLTNLPGYGGAAPVRVGNSASTQYQGDVIGEVMMALYAARAAGSTPSSHSWALQRSLMRHLERHWDEPDNGIWEIRGELRHFTHSRVMTWAALDRAVKSVESQGLDGPVERWRELRDRVAAEIEGQGFDPGRGSYVQYYGTTEVDASLLQLPQVGYCAYDDPRMLGTVAAVEKDLMNPHGLLLRYRTESGVDGLPAGEEAFLTCSFWLVEQYAHTGRREDADTLMDTLLGYANDVGMLSEEYDCAAGRQAGNTPQALTHLALVRAADAITAAELPRLTLPQLDLPHLDLPQ